MKPSVNPEYIQVPRAALNLASMLLAALADGLERRPTDPTRVTFVIEQMRDLSETLRELGDPK